MVAYQIYKDSQRYYPSIFPEYLELMLKNQGGQKSTQMKSTNKCKIHTVLNDFMLKLNSKHIYSKIYYVSPNNGTIFHMCFINKHTPPFFLLCDVNHWTSCLMTLKIRESLMKCVCSQYFVPMHSTCKDPTKFQMKIFEENNYIHRTHADGFPCHDS